MDKSQYLEEIKSTTENCCNIGYKCGYEATIEAYMERHRDNKAYERFKHMPDYGKGVQNNDK